MRRYATAKNAWEVGAFATAFLIFLARAIAYLHERHPNEDAYILFRYVENLAAGHGIVFNVGGPPAEGATDFLWMLLLAVPVWLGMDVAVAAALLNAIGSGIIAFVLFRLWTRNENVGIDQRIFGLLVACCIPYLAGAHASYDGFSVQLYSGLILLTFLLCTSSNPRAIVAMPYLCLAIGLFRPDGVIIGIGFFLVALLARIREPVARKTLLVHGGIVCLLGAGYFAWRYHYFGELLPLPLYVKSRAGELLPGAASNEKWRWSEHGPIPLLAATALFSSALLRARAFGFMRDAAALIPLGMLSVALAFAYQSQNIDWRFQAPIYIGAAATMIAGGGRVISRKPDTGLRWMVPFICALALIPALAKGKKIWPVDYMDSFAVKLAPILDDGEVVVLTEAGRLPYWTETTVYDLVGLNTAYTAKHPPTLAYLEGIEPDVIMFHNAGTLRLSRLAKVAGYPKDAQVVRLDASALSTVVRPAYRQYLNYDRDTFGHDFMPTKFPPVVLSQYLSRHEGFAVFGLRYGLGYGHIIALKTDRPFSSALIAEILRSHEVPYISYAEAKGFEPSVLCRLGAWLAPEGTGATACQ